MFYKICHFQIPTICNYVIMTSSPETSEKFGPLQKQANDISLESIDKSYPKKLFFLLI